MSTIIAIDFETSGLDPHHDRVTLAQYRINKEPVQLIPNPDYEKLHALLDSADLIIGHGLSFDFGFIRYAPRSPDHWDDTLLMSRIVDFDKEKHTLDDVLIRKLGYDPYIGMDKKRLQKSDWTGQLTDEQMKYARIDVEYLHTLYDQLSAALASPAYQSDKLAVIDGLIVQRRGLPVLREAAEQELQHQKRMFNAACSALPVNPLSPKQVSAHLGVSSTGDKVLAEMIAAGNTDAKRIRSARAAKKYVNFLEKLIKHDRFTGTLKPYARSGRFTSSNENLQNLPKPTKTFIGSTDSYIISADFAQLELRTIACLAEDHTMINLFKEGADLHDYVAERLFGPGFGKRERNIAKTYSFSLLYGAGSRTVREMMIASTGIVLDVDEVEDGRRQWLATFPSIRKWQSRGWRNHDALRPTVTPGGRKSVSKMFTDHLSIQNQGAGAEVARIALHDMVQAGVPLINFVHDSYIAESETDFEAISEQIYQSMKLGWELAPFDKHGVPMPVQVGTARNLKDADALENCVYVYGDDLEVRNGNI